MNIILFHNNWHKYTINISKIEITHFNTLHNTKLYLIALNIEIYISILAQIKTDK